MLSVEIQNIDSVILNEELIINAAKTAYLATATDLAECTIRIVGIDEGRELNHSFRQKNKPTNVLSFTYEDDDPESDMDYLGDIVLCYPIVQKESAEQGKTVEHHWMHLVVHGVLHLCGYDHEKTAEAEEMEQLEVEILAKLNVNNPYLSA